MSAGERGADVPRRRAANDSRFIRDSAPKSLYVSRKLLNADELIRWAKAQGFETTLAADDMHVTVAFSRAPVDWFATGEDWSGDDQGRYTVRAGGPRMVEWFGDAVVLHFADDHLEWRHKRIKEAGASWDHPDYQPHVTISWSVPADFDLDAVEPYQGPLTFGPELYAEIDDGWRGRITETP